MLKRVRVGAYSSRKLFNTGLSIDILKMAQELIRPSLKPEVVEEIEEDMIYAIRNEKQELIQVQKEDIKAGQEYIKLPVIAGG